MTTSIQGQCLGPVGFLSSTNFCFCLRIFSEVLVSITQPSLRLKGNFVLTWRTNLCQVRCNTGIFYFRDVLKLIWSLNLYNYLKSLSEDSDFKKVINANCSCHRILFIRKDEIKMICAKEKQKCCLLVRLTTPYWVIMFSWDQMIKHRSAPTWV